MSAALSLTDLFVLSLALETLKAAKSPHAERFRLLADGIKTRHECCDCGAWFEWTRVGPAPERCQGCDEAAAQDVQARGEAQAERHGAADRASGGGYPR